MSKLITKYLFMCPLRWSAPVQLAPPVATNINRLRRYFFETIACVVMVTGHVHINFKQNYLS